MILIKIQVSDTGPLGILLVLKIKKIILQIAVLNF